MRDPSNIKTVENLPDGNVIVINSLPTYDIPDYDLFNEKDFKKYLDDVEKTIRGSFEYKAFIAYLRENMDMNKCSFYQNVNNIDTFKIKIEIHHEPITLYDMCIVVYNKRVAMHEDLDIEMVAKEVMYLHYMLYVGLIPLAETVHELVHNQYLFVPTTKVLGYYRNFVEAYKPYFLPEQLETLDNIEEATENLEHKDDYKDLLKVDYIYVDASGAYDLPSADEMVNLMKLRIHEIKNGSQNCNIPVDNGGGELITPFIIKDGTT